MGSLGDDDGEIKAINTDPNVNFAHSETQILDSQFSHPTLSGTGFWFLYFVVIRVKVMCF
jgi:hypothetical protein